MASPRKATPPNGNTIYENFFGGKKQILKLVSQKDNAVKYLSDKDEKMGPIHLDIEMKNIY